MINLVLDYYNASSEARQKELDYCVKKNVGVSSIDRIFIYVQPGNTPPAVDILSPKVTLVYPTEKLTYAMFFKFTQDHPDDINILANLDIYFDETVLYANNMGATDFYALLRHQLDENMNARLWNGPGEGGGVAQDAWVVRGAIPHVVGSDYTLGIGGGDNHIAYLMGTAGYTVTNPCTKLKIYHYHFSGVRPWTKNPPHPGPYFYPRPE
jgi:hypothetical protein